MGETILTYDDHGAGVPVILIHGFPLNRHMWQPQVGPLAAAGCRVICPDLPGFGTSRLLDEPATIPGYADAVVALLDRLGIERAVVGGMSMGGYVLLSLADRFPERLLGAMYLVTRAAADDAAGKDKRTALVAAVRNGNLQAVPEAFLQVLFAPATLTQNPQLVAQVGQWMAATSAEGVVGGLLAMRDRADFLDRLPELDLPSLVVGAEQDLAVPPAHARQLAAGLPRARLQILPGAGHMANLEQPERFNRVLLEFLASLSAG